MRKVLCLATVLLLTGFALSQTSGSMGQASGSSDEQQLISIEHQWADALKSGDAATLQRIEADNYVFTGADGSTTTKQEDVSALKSGQEKYESAELSDLKAHVDGDSATVTGHIALKGTDRGKDVSGTYEFTDTFTKHNGTWEAVSTKTTKLPASQ